MKIAPAVLVKKLFLKGTVVTINQEVDFDTAEEIALEFNCICEHEVKVDVVDSGGVGRSFQLCSISGPAHGIHGLQAD